ncbi:MAG: anthranilate phosphoribosyltransferase [Bacteroidetes bacterium]|nr:MAG: anthranilate phosphoribosyltransferase [Bacteroidota bacterium]PTM13153.1 MAG: anthranilate phosphoribosyltransferase [Bacteroidota bacterium]
MKAILQQLFQHQTLDREMARQVLLGIATGAYNDVEVASFVTVFQLRAISIEELEGFRDALLELAVPLDIDGQTTIDIVGTGGDGKNTFNISTTAAVVVAGAGYKVSKHGSYGVSSAVGSSDVLIALGYQFTNDADILRRQLDKANICFLHAPLFHPALKAVVPVRKQLGMKTFFNMLGPLVNPIQPTHQLFGTFSLELSRLYHYIMQQSGRQYTIVFALDGYDEISLTGPAKVHHSRGEQMLYPHSFGFQPLAPTSLYGGEDAQAAREIFLNVLNNEATPAQQTVVCANAGLAIHTLCPEKSLLDCVAEAKASIESGRARNVLHQLINN